MRGKGGMDVVRFHAVFSEVTLAHFRYFSAHVY